MSTALTIMAIAATVISPLLAIQTQKFIERYSQKKSLKIDIFKHLMATRSQSARLSSEHVRALNMIDLAFYGKIKKKEKPKEVLLKVMYYPHGSYILHI
ncbi:hypothetical protein QWI28_19100 [Citrobacter freundii]|nr:hypothetical protein [Citrobacter freundii]